MDGWVKLWRKTVANGHLMMPNAAFKLWIYCLLEASPYPDASTGLAAGELWLNYKELQRSITVSNGVISKTTIAEALKYLEDNGYIALERYQFKGVKATIINWHRYQARLEHR